MTSLITTMKREQVYLEQVKCKVEEDIRKDNKHKLPGKLRIHKKGNSVQYYHTKTHQITEDKNSKETREERVSNDSINKFTKDKTIPFTEDATNQDNLTKQHQTYIPKKNIELARNLAQRDYDNKLLHEIEQRQKLLDKFIEEYPDEALEQVYYGMNDYRKALIHPIIETDEQYEKVWLSTPYIRKMIGDEVPVIITENGERVRSKSEKMIADKLKQLRIPYRYEAPLRLGRSTVLHPDFTLLNVKERKEIYYEHFGMMDNPEYVESALNRMELYEKNGIFPGDRLLFSWETMAMPLNMRTVETMLKKFLV